MLEVSKAAEKSAPAKEKIIVALDVETARQAREIIQELRVEVGAFKIGLQLFTHAGASFVREAVASGVKIFLDLKFHDIPNTVAGASVEAARLGVWMFNIHAAGGGEMMRKTVEVVREFCDKEKMEQPKIVAVTVLTSSNRETLRETGIERETSEQVATLARLAAKYELDGVVASPQEVELIRQNVERKSFLIVTPGVRSSEFIARISAEQKSKTAEHSETYEDQKRVMSAGEAARSGSDYLVIGRPILQAQDKILAVREIVKEIEAAITLNN